MNISDDTLMAYADGELDPQTAAAVEAAMAADEAVAGRVRAHRALRAQLASAFAIEPGEAVPDRFSALLQAPVAAPPQVVDLVAARAKRAAATAKRGWRWAEWGGMAAALLLGLAIGRSVLAPSSSDVFAQADGGWVARGALDTALSTQLASAPASAVAVPLSFVAGDGRYCRSFALQTGSAGGAGLAGLACRGPSSWQIELLARQAGPPALTTGDGLRQAATALPPEVLAAVQARMPGEALDAAAEQAARGAGWRR